ncbi:MAG: Sec-independent protein translocase protein TatB [Nitrococcus sp.]|nr:Sec-independent protein translocase protein TatB [Nitrococcus sp.]
MFDVGFWELFVIGLIALIVFGPERLPGLARTLGFWIGRARAAFYSLREEMEREVNADGLRATQRALQREIEESTRPLTGASRRSNDTAAEQQAPPAQPPIEEAAAAHSRRADEPSSPNSKEGANADDAEAERSGRYSRQ